MLYFLGWFDAVGLLFCLPDTFGFCLPTYFSGVAASQVPAERFLKGNLWQCYRLGVRLFDRPGRSWYSWYSAIERMKWTDSRCRPSNSVEVKH